MKSFLTLLSRNLWLVPVIWFCACSSDDDIETNTLTFNFEVKVDGEALVFDSRKYLTPANQNVNFERIKVYLSNVQLRDNGSNEVFLEEDSYHLISFDVDNGTASFAIENVPSSYQISEVKFAIGVDAEANTSIDQLGDLDPTNGMAWDWNTGYKFLLLEGRYFAEDDPLGEEIKMHIGTDKNYFQQSFLLGETLSMNSNKTIDFVLNAFAPLGTTDFSQGTVFMNDERGDQVAQNYKEGLISIN